MQPQLPAVVESLLELSISESGQNIFFLNTILTNKK